ncbi:uncharacterized protein [Rutidosis leptorrhynchoides]|uniref:uncharacterized protein n=1 Tax=Rutidosis leptorrhynchoides TaxID=125765 RepID=UPI003A9A5DCF
MVYKIKLDQLIALLKDEYLFGKSLGDIDKIICAEIPDKEEDPDLYSIVSEFMMHVYKRCDDGHFIMKGDTPLDNRNVVSYNKQLSKQFQSHINVEWARQNICANRKFRRRKIKPKKKQGKDEIADYYSCRYISACEAAWRLFNFPTIYRTPAVYRICFHLPNHEPIYYDGDEDFESILTKHTVGAFQFIEWMNCNKTDQHARQYTYVEFPRYYVWNSGPRQWTRRKSQLVVGRIHFVPPNSGETYYLRILLNKVKGPTCFEDIRTVNGILYDTFKEACYALGLLDDDREYVASIKETHAWASGEFCQSLLVSLITIDSLSFLNRVWNETRDLLSDDLHHECPPHVSTNDEAELKKVLYNLALSKIERMLNSSGSTLKNIHNMPFPDYEFINYTCNILIDDEMAYDRETLEQDLERYLSIMTVVQRTVYDQIIDAVLVDAGGLLFLYGYGGAGKTYVWKTLASAVRARGDIVINVASSGIAALLLTGGRTAHYRFAIPINVLEDSFCNIQPDSELAGLLNKAKLII